MRVVAHDEHLSDHIANWNRSMPLVSRRRRVRQGRACRRLALRRVPRADGRPRRAASVRGARRRVPPGREPRQPGRAPAVDDGASRPRGRALVPARRPAAVPLRLAHVRCSFAPTSSEAHDGFYYEDNIHADNEACVTCCSRERLWLRPPGADVHAAAQRGGDRASRSALALSSRPTWTSSSAGGPSS